MSGNTRSRWPLLILLVAFLLPFVSAVVMRFGGWQPSQTRNFGNLLEPPISMQEVSATADDGQAWQFTNQEHEWTLLVRPAADCAEECRAVLEILPNVRKALGRHAGRLHMFQLAESSDPELPRLQLASTPAPIQQPLAAGAEVWLVDPHGYLVMHYPRGFDPSGLRKDLARLIR